MIEPVTLLATFITLWAQLHNYGIDVESNEYLRNIRVRRDIYGLRNKDQIIQRDHRNSLILNSIYNGREKKNHYPLQDKGKNDTDKIKSIFRAKRSYNRNYNSQISYIEGKVPLANYSPDSPYYSQNSDGVPVYTSYNYNNGYNNAGNGYNNAGNGYNNVGNGYHNVGNGNKLSNQRKTTIKSHHIQSSATNQHNDMNTYNNLATNGQSNGNIMKRISQYIMPSTTLNPNNNIANNGYRYNQGITVTSNGYQNSYSQGINYNSYPNMNTNQGINSDSRQYYNPFGGQINGYNQTNSYTTQGIYSNAGNGFNNGNNGYNNAGNWNNNVGNGNNASIWNYNNGYLNNNTGTNNFGSGNNNANLNLNGHAINNNGGNGYNNAGIWNYNNGYLNNTRNMNYNNGYLNNNTGTWNTANWNFNSGTMNNNAGNGTNIAGNGTNNASNGLSTTEKVQQSYFMSGVGCPKFFKSVTLFGKNICLEDIDY